MSQQIRSRIRIPKRHRTWVCYQCFRSRRTADRPAYIDFVQLIKEQPLSDSSLSSNPREPCHPRLLTQMPLAHAVVISKNNMILVASPNGCSCRTDNCQCIQTCQHLTSTISTDSSSVKHVYGSSRDSRRENWHSATFGISAVESLVWHLSFPEAPRGTTIWTCVECSIAIDTEHRNWQERILFYKGRSYTSTPDPTSEFHWPREADRTSE